MNAKNKLAQDRTDWAEDRTLLASERTFAGWIRTGLTSLVVAIGLQAVFGPAEPTWAPKAVASLFLAASLGIFIAAWVEARANRRAFEARTAEAQPMRRITALSALLSMATLLLCLVLWLL
ncbi:DUF202 domain-containing protein [Palleronia sp. LCG004]|uniref:DUF202 domain-containing protein n=1 Tax=Palleronia sp. LCG004 TaxID=3079304 RepID=UPI0029433F48|nr:DUF202 domain-containing protein [Palleronia sp. LCG004]WOI56780.1 DUF202 domain-containing protein [Palleronia sp. LCG004]